MKYKTSFCLTSAVLSFHLFVTLPAAYAGTYPDDPSALSIVTSTIDADRYKEIYQTVYDASFSSNPPNGSTSISYVPPVYAEYNNPLNPSEGITYKSWTMPSITTAFPKAGSIGGVVLNGGTPVFSMFNPDTNSFDYYGSAYQDPYTEGAYVRNFSPTENQPYPEMTATPDGYRYFFFISDKRKDVFNNSLLTVTAGIYDSLALIGNYAEPYSHYGTAYFVQSDGDVTLSSFYYIGNVNNAAVSDCAAIGFTNDNMDTFTIKDNALFLFNSAHGAGTTGGAMGGALSLSGSVTIQADRNDAIIFAGNVVSSEKFNDVFNFAGFGGAIGYGDADYPGADPYLVIDGATFINNFAGSWKNMKDGLMGMGGAIVLSDASNVNITNVNFYGNGASTEGGSIYMESAEVHLTDVVFSDNFVYNTNRGGAISIGEGIFNSSNSSSLTISAINRDSVFTLNKVNLKDIETTGLQYNDIYMAKDDTTLQLNAADGRSIIMQGGINSDGSTGQTITIGDNSGTYTGTVSISGQFNENFKGSVTVNSGTLQLGFFPDQFTFFGGDVSFADGTTLDNRGTLTLTDKVTFAGNTTISNSGDLILQVPLSQEVKGTGTTIIDTDMTFGYAMENAVFVNAGKSLAIDAANLLNGVGNDGTLTLGSGTLTGGITGQGSTVITGDVSIEGAVTNAVTVDAGQSLTIAASDLLNTVANESGSLVLGDGTLSADITGGGTTVVDGTVVSPSAVRVENAITVNAGKSLTISADDLLGSVSNEGSLVLTGGTLQSEVSGTSGMVVVDGSVVSDALINNGVSINAQKALTASADNIKGNVSNEGILTLTDGTLEAGVSGSGQVLLHGDIVFSGVVGNMVTITSGSTLSSSADNVTGRVNNSGLITLTDGSFNASVSGSGQIVVDGAVAVVDQNSLANPVTINADKSLQTAAQNLLGSVTNESGSVILTGGKLVSGISGSGNTVVTGNVTADALISNKITVENAGELVGNTGNFGASIVVNDGGALTLTGGTLNRDVSGNGRINVGGTVGVAGEAFSFSGDVSVNEGSLTLTGQTGFDLASVNVVSGTLDLGVYQLSSKSLSFSPDSTLSLTVSNASGTEQVGSVLVADSILVDKGAELNFVLNEYNLKKGESKTFTILSANTVTDNFTVADNERFSFEKLDDGVYEITSIKGGDDIVSAAGGSINNQNTAAAWDHVDLSSNTTVSQLAKDLAEMSSDSNRTKEYLDTLTALAPQDKPVVQSMTNKHVNSVMNVINTRLAVLRQDTLQTNKNQMMQKTLEQYYDRLEQGRSGGSTVNKPKGSIWAQGMYDYAKLRGEYGFSSNTYGGVVGVDVNTESFKLGVGYAYTKGDVKAHQRTTDIDNSTIFIYSEYYNPTGYYINLTGSYNFGKYKEQKLTNSYNINSDFNVDSLGVQALIGRNFGIFTPEVGIRYVSYTQDEYMDDLGQTVSKVTADTFTGVLGTKIGTSYSLGASEALIPELRLAATYDFSTDDAKGLVTLMNGTSYEMNYENLDEFSIEAGFGLTYRSANVEVGINYDARFRNDYQEHAGMLNFRYNF